MLELPTGRLLQWLPVGRYVGVSAILWGLFSVCFAGAHNYAGAVALRVCLGAFGASISPGFAMVNSQVRQESSTVQYYQQFGLPKKVVYQG